MRVLSTVLILVASCSLSACSGDNLNSASSSVLRSESTGSGGGAALQLRTVIPRDILQRTWNTKRVRVSKPPPGGTSGIYVAEAGLTVNNILGFPKNNRANRPPTCSLSTGNVVNDIDSDQAGNIIVPNGYGGIEVYEPPAVDGACGTLLGTIQDPYGQASSASALDAVNGTIVVGHIYSESGVGVVTCTLASQSCSPLTSPNIGRTAGVAMDKSGNCYADAADSNDAVGLWYYARCRKTGVELTSANGFVESYVGGVSADNRGNVVVISILNASFSLPSSVTVYSGCKTKTCHVVASFPLGGESVFGHLNRRNDRWVTADVSSSTIDVYGYTGHGTGLKYLYSFDNGLTCSSYLCEAATYGPTSPK
jgi:hypothetical protein